jgi:hypothetical protein
VLDVASVGFQPVDHVVVEPVCLVAEGLIAFEHDHRRTVGLEFVEHLADAGHRDHRGSLVRAHRHRPHLADHFELRHGDVHQGHERDPPDDDRHGQPTDPQRQRTPRFADDGHRLESRSAHRRTFLGSPRGRRMARVWA